LPRHRSQIIGQTKQQGSRDANDRVYRDDPHELARTMNKFLHQAGEAKL
jgi:hypothetical protein